MIRVFTLGMSMPVSMMVVHTSTWVSPLTTLSMTEESMFLSICPWATATVTPSNMLRRRTAVRSMSSMRLCR